jgi:hypothetical protein
MSLFSFIRRMFSGQSKRDRYAPGMRAGGRAKEETKKRKSPAERAHALRPMSKKLWPQVSLDLQDEAAKLQEFVNPPEFSKWGPEHRLAKLLQKNKLRREEEALEKSLEAMKPDPEEDLSDLLERAYTSDGFIKGSASYHRHRAMENKFVANAIVRVISGANRGMEAIIQKGNLDIKRDEWKYDLYSKGREFASGWRHWYAWESELELVRNPGG